MSLLTHFVSSYHVTLLKTYDLSLLTHFVSHDVFESHDTSRDDEGEENEPGEKSEEATEEQHQQNRNPNHRVAHRQLNTLIKNFDGRSQRLGESGFNFVVGVDVKVLDSPRPPNPMLHRLSFGVGFLIHAFLLSAA